MPRQDNRLTKPTQILAAFMAVTSFALLLSTISVLWWFSKYIFGWKNRLPEQFVFPPLSRQESSY